FGSDELLLDQEPSKFAVGSGFDAAGDMDKQLTGFISDFKLRHYGMTQTEINDEVKIDNCNGGCKV
ncbi:MAG: hypothetical protein V2I33_22495, partial [Kangiellaceae bacterium]|nr:hypothetical protein [Kangiellaceae bacterium]